MKFLLNTIAMVLTVASIFSSPLTQAETVASISFSDPVTQANKVSSNLVVNKQAVQNPQQDTNWKNVPTQFIHAGELTSLTENMVNKMVERLSFS